MKVLIVGGSGRVATWTAPYLKERHELRVLDVVPPRAAGVEYVAGSITDPGALTRALDGVDTFVNMVMRSPTSPDNNTASVQDAIDNYNVNTLGLHLLLQTAHSMGIAYGVHTSSFTVHRRDRTWYPAEEEMPLDNPGVYGLTKGFGERICRYFCREFGMSIVALRITGPRDRRQWIEDRKIPKDTPGRAVGHGRGGPRRRLPGRNRGGEGAVEPLRRRADSGRRAGRVREPQQGQAATRVGAPQPPQGVTQARSVEQP